MHCQKLWASVRGGSRWRSGPGNTTFACRVAGFRSGTGAVHVISWWRDGSVVLLWGTWPTVGGAVSHKP
ncbi:hypothetical protein V6N13_100186 [Hibiscus sabdariffa]|uniref:Uncharacterized protein n=1 Tax=Hibiscus sabdariffa TaxID=183260 RepID=A0ABR2B7F1_9ROSI